MPILVCGGAGYIGSHNVRSLLARGEEVVVIDNFFTGHRASLPDGVTLYEGDIRQGELLDRIFSEHRVDAVLHFAASSLVGESMEQPLKYFHNNVHGMQSLLEAMVRNHVDKIVFSSSAAVYGEQDNVPISEDAALSPTNPYGESKLIMERMMHWVGKAHGIRFVSLRYFNVGGAWPGGIIGEDHRPESHLIPLILQVPLGRRETVTIFGNDYPTPDGTCIRDYIGVMDLADAHMRALDYLRAGGGSEVCNLGNGKGFSVREMVAAACRVTGHDIGVTMATRDFLADCGLPEARNFVTPRPELLGWEARAGIDDIIASAWEWHKNHPDGFSA